MATNRYFNNFAHTGEQNLIEDLIIESIQMYGIDVHYLPRNIQGEDDVFNEVRLARFDTAYPVEMYLKNVDGFNGQGKFLSKFGYEIKDEVTFTVSRRVFGSEVGDDADLARPMEGDLIWFPFDKKVFQITFVNHEAIFYQFGKLQTYDITCELFEYSNEVFDTGIVDIDSKYIQYSTVTSPYTLTSQDGYTLLDEDGNQLVRSDYTIHDIDPQADNDYIQDAADEVLRWNERDPFSQGGRY